MKIACKYIKYNPITVNPLYTDTNISTYIYTVSISSQLLCSGTHIVVASFDMFYHSMCISLMPIGSMRTALCEAIAGSSGKQLQGCRQKLTSIPAVVVTGRSSVWGIWWSSSVNHITRSDVEKMHVSFIISMVVQPPIKFDICVHVFCNCVCGLFQALRFTCLHASSNLSMIGNNVTNMCTIFKTWVVNDFHIVSFSFHLDISNDEGFYRYHKHALKTHILPICLLFFQYKLCLLMHIQ